MPNPSLNPRPTTTAAVCPGRASRAIAVSPGYTDLGNRILKVNHAGENGAIHIYAGQIFMARLTAASMVAQLLEFRSHEEKHRAIFQEELKRRGTPRCKSFWLCALGGYVVGLVTGLFGRPAIAATTVAVEQVVLRHLKHQLVVLAGKDDSAVKAISKIVADEQQHHDQSAFHLIESRFWPKLISLWWRHPRSQSYG